MKAIFKKPGSPYRIIIENDTVKDAGEFIHKAKARVPDGYKLEKAGASGKQ